MFSLAPALLLVGICSSWAFVPIAETHGNFKPSAWSAPIPAAIPAAPVQAEGRSYGAARLKHSGYGHQKGGHHKVELGIDPEIIVLKCKVQEPLEHIIWIRQKCPNDHYDGGQLVAEGATVQDKTLYDVRILGGNSSITSELQLKKPLDPSTAGFFRCEAWPHGGGGPSYGQNNAQDVYVIGGQEMLKRCFGGWDENSHFPHDTWAKHRSTEQAAAPSASVPQHPSAPPMHHAAAPNSHYQSSQYQYHQPQNAYVPRYNYSDLRHSSSHEAPSVASLAGRFRKEQQPEAPTTAAPAIITRTGPYQPQQQQYQQQQQQHYQQQVTTTTAAPATQPPPAPVKNFSPAALPPRSYIAATPQPLTAPFVPSLSFSQQMRQQHQQAQEVVVTTQAPKAVNSTQSDWDIEDLMKGYPYREQIRKGKAVKEEVVIVTPEPTV